MYETLPGANWDEYLDAQEAPQLEEELEICPLVEDYATANIREGFDWKDIVNRARELKGIPKEHGLYLVAFRSRRKPNADGELLTALDEAAHQEAMLSPALVHYFKGELDAEGNCLSFCLWTDSEEAHKTTRKPAHMAAARMAKSMYDPYSVELYNADNDGDEVVITPFAGHAHQN